MPKSVSSRMTFLNECFILLHTCKLAHPPTTVFDGIVLFLELMLFIEFILFIDNC